MEKIKTLERAVNILDSFSLDKPWQGVREVARKVNLASSTTGRLMAAMKELGILNQDPVTHTYSIGSHTLAWAGIYSAALDVRTAALPAMVKLQELTNETLSLYVMEGNERVCIERLESPQTVRIVARIGRRIPLYAGSAGKCFLAFLQLGRREEILSKITLNPLTTETITDREELHQELENIRQEGCAVSYGEWILEASGVAAPVFNSNGQIIAALTISGPSSRFTEEKVRSYKTLVKAKATEISMEMGYIPR
jgi:DNA-binding IclR family transcriptional regulator